MNKYYEIFEEPGLTKKKSIFFCIVASLCWIKLMIINILFAITFNKYLMYYYDREERTIGEFFEDQEFEDPIYDAKCKT